MTLPRFEIVRLTVLAFATLLSGAAARAADGVAEINQTCALQTGCFSGDAAGLPVTINGSAGKSYQLTSDLLVPDRNTTAITVTPFEVTIDLNGFSIIGPVTCSFAPWASCGTVGTGDGISAGGPITIKNGSVRGMGRRGLSLGFDAVVVDMQVLGSGDDGILVGGGSAVRNVTASANGGDGVALEFRAAISDSVASNNGGEGIYAFSNGVSVQQSVASYNRLNGIRCNDDCLVLSNLGIGNGQYGLAAPAFSGACFAYAAYAENFWRENTLGTVQSSQCGLQLGVNACGASTTCP